ncbi:hypothetical protein C8T65DRAFT_700150 [Cerioporus squamosus]|nr:hypothetical protein C8T65DRAFT_700150 [Cerioporus squamosus]
MLKLGKRDKAVFRSIFRLDRGRRHEVAWEDFVRAMRKLEFNYRASGKHGGSGRTFTPPEWLGNGTMKLDEPHDRVIWPKDQASLAKRMNEHFELGRIVREFVQ